MRKTFLFALFSLILLLVACGENNNSSDNEGEAKEGEKELDISVTTGSDSANALGAEKFSEEIEKLTDGSLKGKVYTDNTFGGEREVIEMMEVNSLDMAITSTGPMGTFEERFNAIDLPFLFENLEHAYAVMDGDIGEELSEDFEEATDVKILGYMENGWRQPTNSVTPLETVEDAEGLKMRTQENEVQLDTWKSYGANPAPVAWPETFTSLQQGVIDGQANPTGVIDDMSFAEVQDTLAILDDVYSPMPLMISKQKFEEFSEEEQEAIIEAGETATEYQREVSNKLNEEAIDKLEEDGLEVTHPDRDSFEEASEEVYDKWAPEFGEEFIDDIKDYDYE